MSAKQVRPRCTHRNRKNERCKLTAIAGSECCHNHDPRRKVARKKGGRRSRRKGSTFEREVVNDLKLIFGDHMKRGLAQSRFGAGEAPDVDGAPGLWFETKHGKLVNLRAGLQQAVDAMATAGRNEDRWPVAVCKDDRKPPLVVMQWEAFLELLGEWHARRGSAGPPSGVPVQAVHGNKGNAAGGGDEAVHQEAGQEQGGVPVRALHSSKESLEGGDLDA